MVVTPGLQAGSDGAAALVVPGPDGRGQRQVGVIGLADGFFLVGDPLDGDHRAEGFVAQGQHVVGDLGKQGGREEEAVFHVAHRA